MMTKILFGVIVAAAMLQPAYAEASKSEQMFWEWVQAHPSVSAYQSYLDKYADGEFKPLAELGLAEEKTKNPQSAAMQEAPPAPVGDWQTIDRYQVKDGLVKDTKTGLMWMRCSLGQTWNGSTCVGKATEYDWQAALDAAKTVNYAGYSDWRVPTKEELKTLVYCSSGKPSFWNQPLNPEYGGYDGSCEGDYAKPTIFSAAFPNTPINGFWSSSPYVGLTSGAWSVNFNVGYVDDSLRNHSFAVRLVRR